MERQEVLRTSDEGDSRAIAQDHRSAFGLPESLMPAGLKQSGSKESKELENQCKLGRLELVDSSANSTSKVDEKDSDHVNVGAGLSWSREAREHSRPQPGQGYYDVMKTVGADLLGREMQPDEVKLLVSAGVALQEMRGKNAKVLNVHDELLPKNEEELSVFMDHLLPKSNSLISERQARQLKQSLYEIFRGHMGKPAKEDVVTDLRPVSDQPVVTKVVPNAVYIDSSNIEGGQGYRRTPDCEKETQTYWLSRPTAEALMRAQDWLLKNGHDPLLLNNMNAAGRRALDRELISKCAPDQPHAKKHSTHEDGISIDVANYDDPNVRKAILQEGFVHNVDGDRPHFTRFPKKK